MALNRRFRLRRQWPLAGFLASNIIIGYGLMIPTSCIAGVNRLTIGFGASVVGACVTYWVGQRVALSDDKPS